MASELKLKVQYCPRCDRPFTGMSKILAWVEVLKHVKLAHPEYLDMLED